MDSRAYSCIAIFDTQYSALSIAIAPKENRFLIGNFYADICDFNLSNRDDFLIEKVAKKRGRKSVNQQEESIPKYRAEHYYDGNNEFWHKSPVDYVEWIDENTVCMWMLL
jgi:hypothetical protein